MERIVGYKRGLGCVFTWEISMFCHGEKGHGQIRYGARMREHSGKNYGATSGTLDGILSTSDTTVQCALNESIFILGKQRTCECETETI